MGERRLPVRPDLNQLRRQAKERLRDRAEGDAKLSHAQAALAREYGFATWARLVLACRMSDAIWQDEPAAVRDLIARHPRLLCEGVLGAERNWGPPMSYAANLGRDRIVALLRELGAGDVQHAFERAVLQGEIGTARRLLAMGARPVRGSVMGPCETLNDDGLAFLVESGAEFAGENGDRFAPVALLLETYSRDPEGKHRCLEIASRIGVVFPETPPMALHRGRVDLLEDHLRRDPLLFARTYAHREIYPPELGCSGDESLALHGTPLAGATLLHLAVDYDELAIARWMLARGADVDARAAIDAEGFGGHTALFGSVVSQPYRCGREHDAAFAHMLLNVGARTDIRASLRKRLRFVDDESTHEYRNVTPIEWGQQFHDQDWVNPAAIAAIAALG